MRIENTQKYKRYKNPIKFQTGHFENVQNQNIARKIARKHAKTAIKALCSES
jgi:hypothetical protein